ncbi:cation diffusion facilitator family transporter [Candidatus Protochlamydia phocaeensis]|uniref:cation diffusion facilitator family transporter n=1 Tax=Candidatus Protochlamydia phocaeensis TaxID=1414722 RepID=UPI00083829D5|nr:cation diffusion facilitator family transporter [Candidatus Protochlamydia phocaeensis]
MPNHPHEHTHGVIDPSILVTQRGLWAVKWSFGALLLTAIIQAFFVSLSGSVALLGDTIHNFGDAFTAVPIGLAFMIGQRKPTKRFTYGYGRLEDLAGVFVVLTILISGLFAGYASIERFFFPRQVVHLDAVILASLIGFIGNELVAIFRIKVGKEIGSAALIADGYHARTDGIVSLGVVFSVIGIWLGYPLADPIIGLIMTAIIFKIVWESSIAVMTRLLDGVDPHLVDQIIQIANQVKGVKEVKNVRLRWLGHYLYAEMTLTINGALPIKEGHQIAERVHQLLLQQLQFLSQANIRIEPAPSLYGDNYHLN